MKKYEVTVDALSDGERLDKFIVMCISGITRSEVQRLAEAGGVTVNSKPACKNYRIKSGDHLCVTVPDPIEYAAESQDIALDIVFEDSDLLVVNKPKGMVVHPAPGHYSGTLVNALLGHCRGSLSGINGVMRPGIVHRIDKDTSGLLIVAKNDISHSALAEQIKNHSFKREYEAVVAGNIKTDSGTVNAPLGRHPTERKRMAVTEKASRNAVTHYEVIERYRGFTHLRLRLETGRTHQIRAHMAYLGHPVAGDCVYGAKKKDCGLNGQCLHARLIGFVHPRSGEYMEFSSPLPDYFLDFIKKLKIL